MTFPAELLRKDDTALCLFCAAFGGRQDAVFLRDAGLRDVTCVDIDGEKLNAMKPSFPTSWEWRQSDAFAVIDEAVTQWDVVTVDAWSNLEDQVLSRFDKLLSMTKRVLVVGVSMPRLEAMGIDPSRASSSLLGHNVTFRKRSSYLGGTYWIVMEKTSHA